MSNDDRLREALARVTRLESSVAWLTLEVHRLNLTSGCYVVPVVPAGDDYVLEDWDTEIANHD